MTHPSPSSAPGTNRVGDLELMAHADGELPAVRAAEVEQALLHDAALAERHAMYRRSRVLARAAQADALDEPVPPALLAAVRRAAAAGPASVTTPTTDRARAAPAANAPRYVLVASFAALLAGLLGFLLRGQVGGAPDATLAAAPAAAWTVSGPPPGAAQHLVAQALSRQASGPTQVLGDGARLMVIASYRDAGGRLCREFRWSAAASAGASTTPAAEGLACHDPGAVATWQLVALAQHPAPSDGGFQTAGGGLLDAVAKGLGAGEVLSETDEAAALVALARQR